MATTGDSRPFQTIEQQIEGLQRRNLIIENMTHTKQVLLRHNYYCVINGYKKPFLKLDENHTPVCPEIYNSDTRFSEIFNLYKMDKELRGLLLDYILKFETKIKTLVAYHFSKAHPEAYGYLHYSNYSNKESDLSNVLKNIQNLSNKIEFHKQKKYDNAIKHYITKHKNVPLWVLVNFLTFGEMQFLFLALEDSVKNDVCKVISQDFKSEYNSSEKIDIEEIKMIMKAANLFRNVCAHDEVLYIYKVNKPLRTSLFSKYFIRNEKFEVLDTDIKSVTDLFAMLSLLKIATSNRDFKDMLYRLEKIMGKYKRNFKSLDLADILLLMGFDSDWKEQLEIKKVDD